MLFTQNDVIDFSQFYKGANEPPRFHREHFDARGKAFIPNDDVSLAKKLGIDTRQNGILHYFSNDETQNRLIRNPRANDEIHAKFYAVCSPDFSADSKNCFSCFNESNILKARIIAHLWQEAYGARVILTLVWGGGATYKWAFGNVEKGAICAVSHQGIKDERIFADGLKAAIDKIQMESLCWYGTVPDYVKEFYDLDRIVTMQTRTELRKGLETNSSEKSELCLF